MNLEPLLRPRSLRTTLVLALATAALASPSRAGGELPPFDFSDAFLLANGIDPVGLIGRPNGTLPGSVIDPTPNGPEFRDVRVLGHTAAYDHSGHPIFFYVTGLVFPQDFTPDAAGAAARHIADEYK